jgi:hypothetical protein
MVRWKVPLAFVAAALVVLALPAAAYEGSSRLARETVDTTPPTIQQPPNLTVAGTVPGLFQPVSFTVTATDPDNPPNEITIRCFWSDLGVTFPSVIPAQITLSLGSYTMTCSANDPAGNTSATVSFALTVTPFVDTTPPVFHLGNVNVPATSAGGAYIYQPINVTDPDDAASSITISCDHNVAGGLYPIGVTTVTCNAHDPAGNNATPASFTITITSGTTTATTTTAPTTTTSTTTSTTTTTTTTTTATTATAPTTTAVPPAQTTAPGTTSAATTTVPAATTTTTTTSPTSSPATCVVPKLVGLTLTAARNAAQRHHCRLTVTYASIKGVVKGRVIAQGSKPGRRLPRSMPVLIIVSKSHR